MNEWLDEWMYCPDECSSKQGIKRENKSTVKDKKGESKSGSWWAVQDPPTKGCYAHSARGIICMDHSDTGDPPELVLFGLSPY